jgi:hypothetical protein
MAEEDDSMVSLKKIRGTDPDLKIILHYTIEIDGTGGSSSAKKKSPKSTNITV